MNTLTLLSSGETAERAGIPFARLDRWIRYGIIEPVQPANGSGSRRRFSDLDAAVVGVVARAARAFQYGDGQHSVDLLRQVATAARWTFELLSPEFWSDATVFVHLDGATLTIDPADDDTCPDDPDGLHHIGCGCETSDVLA